MAERRKHARQLFVHHNLQQNEIAKLCGVSEKTISKWKLEEDWDRQRAAMVTTKDRELARLYSMLGQVNDAIERREEGARVPNAKEADTINKLAAAIRKLEDDTGIAHKVNAYMDLFNWLRRRDLSKAQELSAQADEYIKSLLS
ncbi:MAG TPA: DUF1804 family protein [Flavobacteriales bacterium]|nr:DUF1804 family protein [Flavobacteriales bacterium]HMR28550.1 DUF1804 family protein [Flavobacteriales bacterium]